MHAVNIVFTPGFFSCCARLAPHLVRSSSVVLETINHCNRTEGLLSACTSSPRPEVMIHESPRGAVYLERIADRAVQATHPISLDEGLITRIFRGVLVVADRITLQSLFGSEAKTARAFSDEDAAFVAPQVAKAFLQARPDQQVGFRLLYAVSPISYPAGGGAAVGSTAPFPTSPQTQTTVGALYVNGLSVHLTLKEFQYGPTSADTIGGPNRYYPDRTGFDSREIAFVPRTAERPDIYKSTGAIWPATVENRCDRLSTPGETSGRTNTRLCPGFNE